MSPIATGTKVLTTEDRLTDAELELDLFILGFVKYSGLFGRLNILTTWITTRFRATKIGYYSMWHSRIFENGVLHRRVSLHIVHHSSTGLEIQRRYVSFGISVWVRRPIVNRLNFVYFCKPYQSFVLVGHNGCQLHGPQGNLVKVVFGILDGRSVT